MLKRTVIALLMLVMLACSAHATISVTSYSQTFQGNGATTSFSFGFVAGTASNVSVTFTDASGNVTVLNTSQYTLTINAPASGQCWGVGGVVQYSPGGSPIASGTTLTVTRLVPYTQLTSVGNQANYPHAIECAMDQIVMQTQQIAGQNNAIATPQSPNTVLAGPATGVTPLLPTWRKLTAADFVNVMGTTGSPAAGNLAKFSAGPPTPTITNADLTGAVTTSGGVVTTIQTNIALPGSPTTTTQSTKDNSTKIATTAYVDAPTQFVTGSGTGNTLTAPRQYFICTTTCTVTPPVPAAGYEFCVMNDDNVSTVITLGALTSSARYENTARTAYGTAGTGTFVSGGAVGDKVCLVGRDSTHYLTASFTGTWTAN